MLPTGDDVPHAIKTAAQWRYNSETDASYLDTDGLYSNPAIFTRLGQALADLFTADEPTVVVGPPSSGHLLGALVAQHLNVRFVRARKNPGTASDTDRWLTRTTPHDYRDRHIKMGWRHNLIFGNDRVLAVDDLVDTGGQLFALRAIVNDIGATWLGASVIIDNLSGSDVRRDLGIKSLVFAHDIR